MDNRFVGVDDRLRRLTTAGAPTRQGAPGGSSRGFALGAPTRAHGALHPGAPPLAAGAPRQRSPWSSGLSAHDRVLVVLIENGGVDLGLPGLVDALLGAGPLATLLPGAARERLVKHLGDELRRVTDGLLESAELTLNRYTAARPELYRDVVVLRDGTASADGLTRTLLDLARTGTVIDLFVLAHGSDRYVSVSGGIDAATIGRMRTALGRPLPLRCVWMMNCVGASLNQAWLDAGALASAGSRGTNYLPEPTTALFWHAWKAGETFEAAATGAYRRAVELLNAAVRNFVRALPVPGSGVVADQLDVGALQLVQDSAPVVQAVRPVTITSDELSAPQGLSSGLATTVVPVRELRAGGPLGSPLSSHAGAAGTEGRPRRDLSPRGWTLARRWEGGRPEPELAAAVAAASAAVADGVPVPLTQHQFDALAVFVLGVGDAAARRSRLWRLLAEGRYGDVPAELRRWTRAHRGGAVVEVPELVQRRSEEAELFAAPVVAAPAVQQSHSYRRASRVTAASPSAWSHAQNPGVLIGGIAVADAAQIGLGAVSVAQAQVSAPSGSFNLVYTQASRMLTNEARQAMPGAHRPKQSYRRPLLHLEMGRVGTAVANVVIEWEGNDYGEIGTPVIRKDLPTSTEWSGSSASITIVRVDRIPLPGTDPRTWPITYSYEGSYDPLGNGQYEFSGEFEVNAFGGLDVTRHEVASRSLADWPLMARPEDYVKAGPDVVVPVPTIPDDQLAFLRSRLP